MDRERRPFCTRLTGDERRAIRTAAGSRGMTASEFVRCKALEAAGQPAPPTFRRRDALSLEVAGAIGQLGRIGSNANQIARRLNSGFMGSNEAKLVLEVINSELSALRAALVAVERGRSNA